MSNVLKIVLVALVVVAAIYDFRFRRIPNWLNLSGVVVGLGLNTFLFAQDGLLNASAGLLLSLAVYIPLYLLRAMGAGDVKLMSAVGAIAGPRYWILIFIYTAIAGGVLAMAMALRKRRLQETLFNVVVLANDLSHFRSPADSHAALDVRNSRAATMPHALAIAAGSLTFVILTA
jgi:prepilin peptidase CpaA